jgi:8-oxo-dGTP diphosphatase
MKQKNTGEKHIRFAVLATDVVLMTIRNNTLMVRLAPVHRPPHFPHGKGLPGGLIDPSETAEDAAVRLLRDKGHIHNPVYVEQLYTFSEVDRDPRGRVVAVAYLALVPFEHLSEEEQRDTDSAWWMPVRDTKGLAYDHDHILDVALIRLRSRVHYTTIVRNLMPSEFTLTELESAYESILKTELDKRNFRKKLLKLAVVVPLNRKRIGGAHRPAELYTFRSKKVEEIELL